MIPYVILPLLVSFFVVLFLMPKWIKKARAIGLIWEDMNKFSHEKVSGSGGIIMILGFISGVFVFIAFETFYLKRTDNNIAEILALLLAVIFAGGIGFIDDLIGWRHGGLTKSSRLILLVLAAIPLMAINVGKDIVSLPLYGNVHLGFVYPLLLIPLGIIGATATFNFLAGFNGLEAGQGILILTALSIVAYLTGNLWLAIIGGCMIMALLAFLIYNFCPAKVFPGDVLTYAIGAIIAALPILGNFEKIAVFFFIPYILETILKVRGRLIKHSFGRPLADGSLAQPYDKIYGLEHAAINLLSRFNIKPTEKRVVYLIWTFQLIIIIIGFIIFGRGLNYPN